MNEQELSGSPAINTIPQIVNTSTTIYMININVPNFLSFPPKGQSWLDVKLMV